jgi:SAM-dependent methyltransferase
MSANSTERFSSRVENYVKYRPHYPLEVLYALQECTGLTPSHVIADIGSGTGISAELFLANGNSVYGVEPNAPMREAGEHYLARFPNFHSVDGTAESTTLPVDSIDYIIAGQAFHWFDVERSYQEFKRILKPNGWVAILWNDRQTDTTPFLIEYEQLLLEFGTDYVEINHRNTHTKSAPDANITGSNASRVEQFFHGSSVIELHFANNVSMDYDGLEGRLLSSSYVPGPGEERYDDMLFSLKQLFQRHRENDLIEMRYTTLMYLGQF